MTVLTQFFCKMYFLYVSRGRKKFLGEILWVLPLQKPFFSQPLGSSWVLQKLRIMRGLNSPRCKIKSIVITISNAWSAIFEMIRNFWKTSHPTKKSLPDPPKKWKWGPQKKVFPRIHHGMYILQKTRSNLVYFGLWSLISDLPPPPIGGHHPVLYFQSQIQRNIVQRCASSTHTSYHCSTKIHTSNY